LTLELKNFYHDPAYAVTVKDLHVEVERLRKEVGETVEPPRAAFGNQPFENEPKRPAAAPGKK
jgi:hypothetical protein